MCTYILIGTMIIHAALTFVLWKLGTIERFPGFHLFSESPGKSLRLLLPKKDPQISDVKPLELPLFPGTKMVNSFLDSMNVYNKFSF